VSSNLKTPHKNQKPRKPDLKTQGQPPFPKKESPGTDRTKTGHGGKDVTGLGVRVCGLRKEKGSRSPEKNDGVKQEMWDMEKSKSVRMG